MCIRKDKLLKLDKMKLENENSNELIKPYLQVGGVMRSFSLKQYRQMAERFNKMSFRDKILTVQKNSDILTLASDGNWWGVKVKDKEIEEQLSENEWQFNIVNEWGSSEMFNLIDLLYIGNTDI
jgi:serine/threonine protein phosphatase PrpC